LQSKSLYWFHIYLFVVHDSGTKTREPVKTGWYYSGFFGGFPSDPTQWLSCVYVREA